MKALVISGVRIGSGGPVGSLRIENGVLTAIEPDLPTSVAEQVVDLSGHTVLPGLVDSHVHAEQWARHLRRIDVLDATSPQAAIEVIRADLARRDTPVAVSELVTGGGFRDGLWTDPPHKRLLDAAFGQQPVAVWSMDIHALWMSSAALALIERSDHPTGVLREEECMQASAALGLTIPEQQVDAWVGEMTHAAAARGVTEIVDFEYADTVSSWQRRLATTRVDVRVQAGVWRPWMDQAVERGHRTGAPLDRDGLLRVGPFKVITDGSLNTRTASCHDPYPDLVGEPDAHGLQVVPAEELVALLRTAAGAGLRPAVHAIGDRANSIALDAFEAVGCGGSIEHAQLVRPQDVRRFAELGVVASVQPQHAVADRDVADHHWRGRTQWAFPYGALHAAGVPLLLGSDAPVSPLDPWAAVADAVSRTDDERPPWHPEHVLPVDVALTAASGGRAGLRVGDRADLAIVGLDPATATPQELREMPVAATLLAGRFTHRR